MARGLLWLLVWQLASVGSLAAEPAPDPWGPWRRDAGLIEDAYEAGPEPPRRVPMGMEPGPVRFPGPEASLPFTLDPSDHPLNETDGVEVSFRFRVARVPPARLEESHSLALWVLQGPESRRGFWLHAYSRGSGFCLNGIAADRDRPHQETRLARGAARPQSAPRWDTQWHTVRLAWCRGQLAASWDGLPVLHLVAPGIDYEELVLEWVDPGHAFGALELGPFEVRPARFTPP